MNFTKKTKKKLIEGAKKSAKIQKDRSKQKKLSYELDPKICPWCEGGIPYEKRYNTYCSSSCSTQFNNAKRTNNGYVPPHKKYKDTKCLQCKVKISGKQKYCSHKCHSDYEWEKYKKEIEQSGNGNPRNNKTNLDQAKRYLLEKRGCQCEICKNTTWQEQQIPLVLDHIDGHSENNNLDNLRLVCGNCDMLLPTYKSKNIGNGRHARRKRYAEGKSY